MLEKGRGDPLMEIRADKVSAESSQAYRMLTLAGLVALAVLVLAFNQDIGFVSITIGLALSLIAPNLQKRAIGQVSWPEIMLITGVSTYVTVLEKMGTISLVGDSVAGLGSPHSHPCYFASSAPLYRHSPHRQRSWLAE